MFKIDKESFEPAYYQLKRQIVEKINNHEYQPGDMIPSVRELAKITGLSHCTTAKAVNELVQESVVLRQKGIGNIVKDRQCRTIGITGSFEEKTFFHDPYYMGIMNGVNEIIASRDIAFTFKHSGKTLSKTFEHNSIDGMMIFGVNTIDKFMAEIIELSKTEKIIALGGTFRDLHLNYVDSDNYKASFKSTELIIQKGYKKFALFTTDQLYKSERIKGVFDALKKYKIPFNEDYVFKGSDPDKEKAVKRLISLKPSVIFSGSSYVAHQLLGKYLSATKNKKNKTVLITYDPLPDIINKFKLPNIYISQPLKAIGRSAAENLIGLVERTIKAPVRENLQSEIIVNL